MGSTDNSGYSTTTIRYAPYLENAHKEFLTLVATKRASLISSSPFSGFSNIEVDSGFFGSGYIISSFPSLYDMYGKFMAGLDIDVLFSQTFTDVVNSSEVADLASAEAALMDADIAANILPRFQVGMRDINSVMASTYVVGTSLIEDARVKALEKFRTALRFQLIPVAVDKWKTHLAWNESVIKTYAEVMKLYFSAKLDLTEFNYTMQTKNTLWPFTVLEFERAALGVLQGAYSSATKGSTAGEPSTMQKALSGALSGAAAGMMIPGAGPVGGVVGGLLGLAGGLFS